MWSLCVSKQKDCGLLTQRFYQSSRWNFWLIRNTTVVKAESLSYLTTNTIKTWKKNIENYENPNSPALQPSFVKFLWKIWQNHRKNKSFSIFFSIDGKLMGSVGQKWTEKWTEKWSLKSKKAINLNKSDNIAYMWVFMTFNWHSRKLYFMKQESKVSSIVLQKLIFCEMFETLSHWIFSRLLSKHLFSCLLVAISIRMLKFLNRLNLCTSKFCKNRNRLGSRSYFRAVIKYFVIEKLRWMDIRSDNKKLISDSRALEFKWANWRLVSGFFRD